MFQYTWFDPDKWTGVKIPPLPKEYISFEDVDKYPYGNDETITGYEYEVLGCMDAIKKGHTECPEITHKETLFMMETMDEIRRQMGVIYPFES